MELKFRPAVGKISGRACQIHVIQENEIEEASRLFKVPGLMAGDFLVKFDGETRFPDGHIYRAFLLKHFAFIGDSGEGEIDGT